MQNFGKIKNTFNNLLVEGIAEKTNENKTIFGKFVKAIQKDRILKTQFNVYYDIEKKAESNEFKSTEFVKESISLLNKYKKEDIALANQKLISILEKYNLTVSDEDYDKSELHENISKLIFTKKNSGSIDTIVESLDKVVSYVKENTTKTITNEDFLPNSFIGNLVVEKFNTKYSTLSDNEKKVFKTIIESDEIGKKEILVTYISECIVLLNSKLQETTEIVEKEALLNVKEALLKLEYTNENFISDIGRIIDLKQAIDD